MKVALLLDSQDVGGIETHVAELVKGLASIRIKPDVVFYQQHVSMHPMLSMLKHRDCNLVQLDGRIGSLQAYLQTNKPLLHTHGYKAGIIGRLLARWMGLPVVSTFHNGDPGKGKMFLYNQLDRLTSFLSENICVNRQIAAWLPSTKHVIPNFIDIPEQQGALTNRHKVAFIGRMSHEKGPDIFTQVCEPMPYRIALYGSGPMLKRLESENPGYQFYGRTKMDRHWQDIRVVAITSRYEGLPLVALEAMARGIPVAASNSGALPDLLPKAGLGKTIDCNNSEGFREEIERWMTMDNRRYIEHSEKMRDFIRANYSLQKRLPDIMRIYQSALGKRVNQAQKESLP